MLSNFFIISVSTINIDGEHINRQLDSALKLSLPDVPRRLNKYIKLALLGATTCCRAITQHKTDVFVTAKHLSFEVMTDLLESSVVTHQPPKPINFIHSIGNSASFYVSQQLKLQGESLFLAETNDSFAHLLLLASHKLAVDVPSVLLGNLQQGQDFLRSSWLVVSSTASSNENIRVSFESVTRNVLHQVQPSQYEPTPDFYQLCRKLELGEIPNKLHTRAFSMQSGLQCNLYV